MVLSKLSLQNFRNYKQREFEFSPILTIIIGPNTTGKTNIIEAIYLVATGSSFRAGVDKEMIRSGEELARVKCKVGNEKWETEVGSKIEEGGKSIKSRNQKIPPQRCNKVGQNHTSLEIVLTSGSVQGRKAPYKKYLVNGIGRRKSDFVGNFYAVVFHPQDIELITDSPSRRRVFLDNVLVQVSSEYSHALTEYEKTLRRRNKLLSKLQEKKYKRDARASFLYHSYAEQLEYWDRLLIENGAMITKQREEFIDFLNRQSIEQATKNHFSWQARLLQKGDNVVAQLAASRLLEYNIGYNNSEISYERLRRYSEREIAAGYTLIGPHRDDFVVKIQSNSKCQMSNIKSLRELSAYGSRGEQRLAVLWLKLGELEYLKEETGERPVLLLDDIFSELDHEHRELVVNIIPQYQTIITTADSHYVSELTNMQGVKIVKII